MKKCVKFVLVLFLFSSLVLVTDTKAQEYDENGYTVHSVRPFHRDDILFQKRVWREINLEEKQNMPFMSKSKELSKIIVEAAKAGRIPIYTSDSLTTRMTKEEFLDNLKNPLYADQGGDDEWGGDAWGDTEGGDDWGDFGGAEEEETEEISDEFDPATEIVLIEVMEDMIFDRKRSRLYWDILSFKLQVPARKNTLEGINRPIAVFKYTDLYNLFEEMGDEAVWFNPQNSAEHRNFTAAFDLRLFSSRIVKIANPENIYLEDETIIGNNARKAIMYQIQKEYELMELEHELWEY